jgi:hypothetical protein
MSSFHKKKNKQQRRKLSWKLRCFWNYQIKVDSRARYYICIGAQDVTLQNIFCIQSLFVILLWNLTHKTETGIANKCGTTNSKPPGPIIMMGLFRNSHILYINSLRPCVRLSVTTGRREK